MSCNTNDVQSIDIFYNKNDVYSVITYFKNNGV
jgi:hypothetical protein